MSASPEGLATRNSEDIYSGQMPGCCACWAPLVSMLENLSG